MSFDVKLGVIDYILSGIVFAATLGICIFQSCRLGRKISPVEYYSGHQYVHFIPATVSMLLSLQSPVLMVGLPVDAYMYGGIVTWTGVGICLSHLIGARIVVPMLHPLKLPTINKYFHLRYRTRTVQIFCALCSVCFSILYISIILYGQASALEKVSNIPTWVSVIIVCAVGLIIHVTLGGIQAIIWTDVFLCTLLMVGMMAVVVKGIVDSGGFSKAWTVNKDYNRLNMFQISFDPIIQFTVWNQVIGGALKYLYIVVNQSAIQRINICRTQKQATLMYSLAGLLFIFTVILASSEGLMTYAYFTKKECDPIESNTIDSINQLVPYVTVHIFQDYEGVPGLFLAAVVCASLSTILSEFLGLFAIIHHDFLKPHFRNTSEIKLFRITKAAVIGCGIISIAISFGLNEFSDSIFQIAISLLSTFGVPIVGLYLYAIFFPSATQAGSIAGGVCSIILILWINIGRAFYSDPESALSSTSVEQCPNSSSISSSILLSTQRPVGVKGLYSLSSYWYDVIGLACFFLVAVSVTFCGGRAKIIWTHGRLMFSFGERFFSWLPQRIKEIICCGDQIEYRRLDDTELEDYGNTVPRPTLDQLYPTYETPPDAQNGKNTNESNQNTHSK